MTAEELEALRRRELLSSGPAVVGALLVGGIPSRADLFEAATAELDRLWLGLAQNGSASIMRPVRLLAEHLAGAVRAATPGSEDHRRAAELTGRTALLAGLAARDQDLPGAAIGWRSVQIRAGQAARSADQVAAGLDGIAWSQFTALNEREQAFRTHDRIRLDNVSPACRGVTELRRAEMLAKVGKAGPAWAALKRARATVVDRRTYTGPPTGPLLKAVTEPLIELFVGKLNLELGYGDLAYPRLKAASRLRPDGQVQLELARAAGSMGEPELACVHLARADHLFAKRRSPLGARHVREYAAQLLEIADTPAVRDLLDQLRTEAPASGHRYVVTRTQSRRDGLHRADCRYMRRGQPSEHRRTWSDPARRSPAELAADPAVQARYAVCKVCMR